MAAITLDEMVADVARGFGAYAEGVASEGSTTTLTDAARIEPDNAWVNHYLYFVSGGNAAAERLVTAHDQATATLTFEPAADAVVASGNEYQLTPLRRAEYEAAIKRAVRRAGTDWLVIKLNEDSFMTGVQLYTMPADCVAVLRCWVWSSTDPYDTQGQWRPFQDFEIIGAAGEQQMQLRHWAEDSDVGYSYARRIEYVALPGVSALGLSEASEREAVEFVINYALYLLHLKVVGENRTGSDARAHNTLAERCLGEAERIRLNRTPLVRTRHMRTWNPGGQR